MKKGFIFVAVLALLVMVVPGCAPEGAPPSAAEPEGAPPSAVEPEGAPAPTVEWGIIEIRVTDPPPADVNSALVTVENMEIHRVEGGWLQIIPGPETFDLMALIEQIETLGSANVTAGKYTGIRMDVIEVEVVFFTDNVTTDTVIAEVPSEKLKIVKPFEVNGDWTTIVTLDFDGEKSLVLPGKDIDTGKERALFKPVVKLSIEEEEE